MSLPGSENVLKDSPVMTPSQDTSAPAINHADSLDHSDAVAAIELPHSSLDLAESGGASKKLLDKGNNETFPTIHQDSGATVSDEKVDNAVNDTQEHADKTWSNGAADISAEIQQLHRKIEELSMQQQRRSYHVPPPPMPMTSKHNRPGHNLSGMAEFLFGKPHRAPPKSIETYSLFDGSVDEPPNIIPKLNRVPWIEFQECIEPEKTEDQFAIDVLVGEPEVIVDFGDPYYSSTRRYRYEEEYEEDALAADGIAARHRTTSGKTISRGQRPLPERIRINSLVILKILSKILQEDLSEKGSSVLMMRPFRALVRYKDEIRKWKEKLETRLEEPETTQPRSAEESTGQENGEDDKSDAIGGNKGDEEKREDVRKHHGDKSKHRNKRYSKRASKDRDNSGIDEDSFIETREALDQLKCLVEFIDTDLEEKIAYLASPDCQRVVFSDIWHLFKPGDFVVSKDEKQAYRIIQVKYSTHGMKQPSLKNLWVLEAKAKLQNSPITIECVHIDFDGERIGPVSHNIDFYRFDGEKSIRSLDIIPLRMSEGRYLKERLVERGSLFLEVSDTQRRGTPMHYSGLELETQEEIDSQVVIDFEEAIAANDEGGKRKANGFTLEKLVLESFARMLKEEGRLELSDVAMGWKPTLRNLADDDDESADDSDAVSTDSEGSRRRSRRAVNRNCIPECCSSENVHDDIHVERNLSNEFIQSQYREQATSNGRIPSLAIAPRPLKEATEDENFITDDEKLILSYRVYGFILRSRKWAKLDLSYLGPMRGQNTFDLLVLPPGHREMVESLVTQHFLDKASAYDETDEVDIVRGKGKGLILLLHGAPGVGKTTTAECVATYFHKPLFQITCGDLGSTADVVESRLETNFALASRWGCILLIDEADVFLEARQTENFDRNSLVAVFLRTLEYYSGILFLTTNRVGTFDEAFTSRIHISLYYPPLSQASTLAVFNVNLTRIQARFKRKKERGEADLELDERSINAFILGYYAKNKEARWNGRQIRNACQTALALAEFEAQKLANPAAGGGRSVMDVASMSKKMINVRLTSKHFQDVAKAYLAFMRYLREVHGVSAAQQAKNFRLRHDRYGLGESTSLLASRQRAFVEETRPSYGHRYMAGGASNSRGQRGQQGRGPAYRQPRQDDYMENDEYLDEYEYDEEDLYNQESGHDPTQYDEDEADFEDEPFYEQEDEYNEKRPDFEDEQTVDEYAQELEDERSFGQSEYAQETQAKPRARPGPSKTGRREQLPARGAGRVRVTVGGRGSGPGPSQQVSNRGLHGSMGRGKAPARGQGRRGIPRHRVSGPANEDDF
ncbi:hypothetical protein NW762_012610 [Fusarium torreyae]|uniref:AAA+ ATPase domain-containing protein n=1 Tax=Fusarium torreyae TaxID=1237075 RepID=A0A9W8RQX4_9HYPO|nr:hypothetical protein NW762_012610 [Fusarium torreyae]